MLALPFFGGLRGTPARRALLSPIAMACCGERAPCLPSRTCSISSCTNSPAAVDGDFPSRKSSCAFSRVSRSSWSGIVFSLHACSDKWDVDSARSVRRAPAPCTLSWMATQPEPWLRGTHTEIPAVLRAVVHALELAREDIDKWCAPLSDEVLNARPGQSPDPIAPVAFHLRHIVRSLDRLLTYAEGEHLRPEQLAALRTELDPVATHAELFSEFRMGIATRSVVSVPLPAPIWISPAPSDAKPCPPRLAAFSCTVPTIPSDIPARRSRLQNLSGPNSRRSRVLPHAG